MVRKFARESEELKNDPFYDVAARAADDDSPLRAEMMQIALQSMVGCLPSCAESTYHCHGQHHARSDIICPNEQTSLKKPRRATRFFFGATCPLEPTTHLRGCRRLPAAHWYRNGKTVRRTVLPYSVCCRRLPAAHCIATAKQSTGLFCLRQLTAGATVRYTGALVGIE